MKLIIENFRKFISEDITVGISKEIDDETLDKVFEWAGVEDKSSVKHPGSASMGSAYRISSRDFGDVVLKITNDSSEAHSTTNLVKSGQEHPNVYKVFKVARIPTSGRPRYAIITELLNQPDPAIQYAMGSLFGLVRLGEKGLHRWRGYGNNPTLDQKLDVIAQDAKSQKNFQPEKIKEYIDKIASGLTFLNELGIFFDDLKASNILQRGDEPVIIDLGRIGLPKYMPIDTID